MRIITPIIDAFWPFHHISKEKLEEWKDELKGRNLLATNMKRLLGFIPFYIIMLIYALINFLESDTFHTAKVLMFWLLCFILASSVCTFFYVIHCYKRHLYYHSPKQLSIFYYLWWWINTFFMLLYGFIRLQCNHKTTQFFVIAFFTFFIPLTHRTGLIRKLTIYYLTIILLMQVPIKDVNIMGNLFENWQLPLFLFGTFYGAVFAFISFCSYKAYLFYAYIYYSINMDSLTLCHNRRGGQQALDRLTVYGNMTCGVLMLDIDHFKQFNDTLGHNAGDDCLVFVAHVLKVVGSRNRCICIRQGGEEFALFCPFAQNIEAVKKIAQEIQDKLFQDRYPAPLETGNEYVTLSIGLSCELIEPDIPYETYLLHADKALYESKHNGRNQISVYGE